MESCPAHKETVIREISVVRLTQGKLEHERQKRRDTEK
jgi:hypothetical protein